VTLLSGNRVWLPDLVDEARSSLDNSAVQQPCMRVESGVMPASAVLSPPPPPPGVVTATGPSVAAQASQFRSATMRAWAEALQCACDERRDVGAVPAGAGAISLAAALIDVRAALGHRAKSTTRGHFYAVRAFSLWLSSWEEVQSAAATPASVEDMLCIYTLARRHATVACPILWPGRLGKRSVRAHTMAIRGAIRVTFALPSTSPFPHHTALLKSVGANDPPPLRAFTFPCETVEAWRDALRGKDLAYISWAASLVVFSIFGLRPAYWHDLSTSMFKLGDQMNVLRWQYADKTAPARFGETPDERVPRVTAADHPVLTEVIEYWWPLLARWGTEILCPVIQPLRFAGAHPKGATVCQWGDRQWCVWPKVRRSLKWSATMLRSVATRLKWPRAADRKLHGCRGGRSLEARVCGVSREVRSAFCWWSLKFQGAGLFYEPPTLGEMADSTRTFWASTPFVVLDGVPSPEFPRGHPAVAGRGRGGARAPGRGRGGRGRGRGRGGRAVVPSDSEESDSTSDSSDDSSRAPTPASWVDEIPFLEPGVQEEASDQDVAQDPAALAAAAAAAAGDYFD
jgi:hypothetical protein